MADVWVAGAEIGEKSDQVRHMFGRLASGKPGGKGKEKEEYAVHGLFLSGFARIDQFPEFRIFGKNLVFR